MRKLATIWLVLVLVACTTSPSLNNSDDKIEDPGVANVVVALKGTVNIWGAVKSLDGTPLGRLAASGVIVAVHDGVSIILTAGHVFQPNTDYTVENSRGEKHSATFYHVSKTHDLGLLWVNRKIGEPAELAVAMPKWGKTVYVVGNKLGGGIMPTHGIYGGLISSKFARCSAPTHPGNSGGGVWTDGELIGIASRIPGVAFDTNAPGIKSKQLFPTVCMFVPVQAIHAYLQLTGAKNQITRPDKLEKAVKVILPPTPDKWEMEIR